MVLSTGCFYFLKNQYCLDFADPDIQTNKEMIDGQSHNRPFFFAIKDTKTGLFWMIPVSSQVEKYKKIAEQKISRYGKCDTILFGEVFGKERAFLIQNMCPVSLDYIAEEYKSLSTGLAVRVESSFETKLIKTARRILLLQRKGIRLIFPDVDKIEKTLLSKIDN